MRVMRIETQVVTLTAATQVHPQSLTILNLISRKSLTRTVFNSRNPPTKKRKKPKSKRVKIQSQAQNP